MDERLLPYDYHLPAENIAVFPLQQRDQSKMMVLNGLEHPQIYHTSDLLQCLNAGDVLVLNNTKVLQARIMAQRSTGGKVELLFLGNQPNPEGSFLAMVKPSRKLHVGDILSIPKYPSASFSLQKYQGDGQWWVSVDGQIDDIMMIAGSVPIPPYLKRTADEEDQSRYQTVFAKHQGAVAAPTAGLHLTDDLLQKLQKKGVQVAHVTLHVGVGTFRNLRSEDLDAQKLHAEWFSIPVETQKIIQSVKKNGGRVVAVGTTVTRTLESAGKAFFENEQDNQILSGYTEIFIQEGYSFEVIDALLTNFHLPQSSLLMLVCAFAGRERILQAYQQAIEEGMRFFSYGDAMLILPHTQLTTI